MKNSNRFIYFLLITFVVAGAIASTSIGVLYNTAFEVERVRLIEIAKNQARMIEAVAGFDQRESRNFPGGPTAATIAQLKEAHKNLKGFGETGEFTLAKLEGDQIKFILNHRHTDLDSPRPVPLNSKLAEPMRRALSGQSGSVVGLDYRGATVLAAYEPVAILDFGVVSKIDLAEIRAPFVKASGVIIMVMLFVLTVSGVFLRQATQRQLRAERILRNLVEGTSATTGSDFFQKLVQNLAEGLDVDYALIGQVPPDTPGQVRTMSVWAKGGIAENIKYKLAGTPCENVVGKDTCSYPEHVQQQFPTDHMLVEMGVEAYAGVPLFSRDGEALGLLAVLDGKPMHNQETVKSMLSFFSARASAELERERAISNERKASERINSMMNSIHDAFFAVDKEWRLTYANEQAEAIFGRLIDEMRGQIIWNIIPEFASSFYKPLIQSAHRNEPTSVEGYYPPLERWFDMRAYPANDGLSVYLLDDTSRHKAEEELIHHRDRLEELVAVRTAELEKKAAQLEQAFKSEKKYSALQQQFVSLVSHEFRTPLTIIDSTAQRITRLKDKITPDELVERSGRVRSAVGRMVELIDTTLYAERIDAGKIEMRAQPCKIRELVEEVCNYQCEVSPNHEIIVDLDGIPEQIDADFKLLEHVFANLLSNAVKYAPGNPLIEVSGETNGNMTVISIRDHGLGISKNDLPNMFQRFFRAGTAEGIQGTGIGLSVCKQFVEMHGGSIAVDSVIGEGSTFTVQLPIVA